MASTVIMGTRSTQPVKHYCLLRLYCSACDPFFFFLPINHILFWSLLASSEHRSEQLMLA